MASIKDAKQDPNVTDEQVWSEDVTLDTFDGDVMAAYHTMTQRFVEETERKLVRKIDLRILPLVVIIYIMNYLDRNSIVQARLYGIQKDTGVKGAMWQTAISILSAGYIAMQIPATLYMSKARPSIFLPCCMIIWAVVSACTGAVHNTAGLLTVRFFLGLVEAPFFPCAIFFLSCWYRKRELGIRMALLVSGLILSNAFAGLISAGILQGMKNVGGLHSWRWLFILEGMATIVVAVVALFTLPDYPSNTRWLSRTEKIVAQARLAIDVGSTDVLSEEKVSLFNGLRLATTDFRVWMFALMQMCVTASISFSHFLPTLIKDLGFKNSTTALLLTSPPYLLAFFWAIFWADRADRNQVRSTYAFISIVTAIVGAVTVIAVPQQYQWPRYALMYLLVLGTYGVYTTTYTWLSSTIARPPVKRAASIGIANTFANCASLYGNYFWLDKYGPNYTASWGCVLAFLLLAAASIGAIRWLLARKNKKFEQLTADIGGDPIALSRLGWEERRGVTEGFRYVI